MTDAKQVCRHCGASYARNPCWLCGAALDDQSIIVAEVVSSPRGDKPADFVATQGLQKSVDIAFAVATIGMGVTIALVTIGAFLQDPGRGIGFLILVVPAFTIGALRLLWRRSQVGHVTWMERFITYLLSGIASILLLLLLGVGVIIFFFLVCLVQVSKMQ